MAAIASVHYDKNFYEPQDEIDTLSAKPDFTILCYPVIDMQEFQHSGTWRNMIGSNPKESEIEFYSLNLHVTTETSPTFLWHTANDCAVPVENSMMYAMALSKHNVPYELHIYPAGRHGLWLAKEDLHVGQWSEVLRRWLRMYIADEAQCK